MIALLSLAESNEVLLLAPDLLIAEAGQVIWKKWKEGLLTEEESTQLLESLLDWPIRFVPHKDLIASALEIARKQKITVYDALFLSLAKQTQSELITADIKLKKIALSEMKKPQG
jgi:predicted nucleic acid-binding protein